MNKKVAILPIIVAVAGLAIVSSFDEDKADKTIFHVRLADPEMYENGIFTSQFVLNEGKYTFRFVPNGDSPKSLSISLKGDGLDFRENFLLNGTSHETGISQYFTWDYDGQKEIETSNQQSVTIEVDPHGNVMGPVSVFLEEIDGVTP